MIQPSPPPLPPGMNRPRAVDAVGGKAYPPWQRLVVIFAPLATLGLAYVTGIIGGRGGLEPASPAALPTLSSPVRASPRPAEPSTPVVSPPSVVAAPTPVAPSLPPKPTPAPARTAAESYQRARAKHPALNYPDTPYYQQFTAEMGRLKAARDPLLDNPSFPEIVADKLGEQLVKH